MRMPWMAVLAFVAFAGSASAKSLYVNKAIGNSPIAAYDIDGTPGPTFGCLTYQSESDPTRYGGAGLAIDTDSETLFVTFEGSGKLDIVDATTLNILGQVTAPDANNLAGIVVDQGKSKVYTANRASQGIYEYDWNSSSKTLTLVGQQTLATLQQAYGLALDEVNNLLYVADLMSSSIKVYSTNDWSMVDEIPVSQAPMGVAVYVTDGFLYSGNAGSGCNGNLIRIDLKNGNTESTFNIRSLDGAVSGDCVVGVAVDSQTGYVYVTTGYQYGGGSDRILVFDSTLALQCAPTEDIGDPTGIVIPDKEISYNPLSLTKEDGLSDEECVYAGSNIDYVICFGNTLNDYDVEQVTLVDTLPPEVTFVTASNPPTQVDGNTLTWSIGTLGANQAQQCITVTVNGNPGTSPLTEIANSVVIQDTFPGNRQIPTTQNEETTVCPNTPPVAVCTDVTATANENCEAMASIDNGSYDPDGADDIASITETPPGPHSMGEPTEVTLVITDIAGATDSCTGSVTVVDETDPVPDCNMPLSGEVARGDLPLDVTAQVTDNCGATVAVTSETCAHGPDTCDATYTGDTITLEDFEGGDNAFKWTIEASDDSGNTVTKDCELPVVNTPPDCSDAKPSKDILWPPNHKFHEITVEGVIEPDKDPFTINIDRITSDEPTATITGAGRYLKGNKEKPNHAPDASGVGTSTASLRAERSGNQDGRVYCIEFTATDDLQDASLSCSDKVCVGVPHDQKDTPVDSGQNYDATVVN